MVAFDPGVDTKAGPGGLAYDKPPLARAARGEVSLEAFARIGHVFGVSRAKTLKAIGIPNSAPNRAWYDETIEGMT